MSIDDHIRVEQIDVSKEERSQGITAMRAISMRRVTIVLIVDENDIIGIGFNVAWPKQVYYADMGLSNARRSAINNLMRARASDKAYRLERAAS